MTSRAVALIAVSLLAAACQFKGPPKQVALAAAPPGAPGAEPAASASGDPMFPDLEPFRPRNHPAGSCVSEAELEADQFIRLHTELMVTGLTCQVPYGDPTLFVKYAQFTSDHQNRVRDAQSVLSSFLSEYQSGSGARLFDTYRTEMANDESQLVINVSTARYCQALHDKFYAALDFGNSDLQAYLDQAADRYRARYSVCGGPPAEAVPAALPAAPVEDEAVEEAEPAEEAVPAAAPPPPPAAEEDEPDAAADDGDDADAGADDAADAAADAADSAADAASDAVEGAADAAASAADAVTDTVSNALE